MSLAPWREISGSRPNLLPWCSNGRPMIQQGKPHWTVSASADVLLRARSQEHHQTSPLCNLPGQHVFAGSLHSVAASFVTARQVGSICPLAAGMSRQRIDPPTAAAFPCRPDRQFPDGPAAASDAATRTSTLTFVFAVPALFGFWNSRHNHASGWPFGSPYDCAAGPVRCFSDSFFRICL